MDPASRTALRVGAYALLFLDRVPGFAAVDASVALVKRHGSPAAAGFVNAVLRRVAREGSSLLPPEPPVGDVAGLARARSHPEWWVRRMVARLGWEGTAALLEANNHPAPTVLRPNLRRVTPEELTRRLEGEGVRTEPCAFVPEALRVRSGPFQATGAFRGGDAWVQDEAAQLVPKLLGPRLRPPVADLCAAPGGKALQLSEAILEGGPVIAADRHHGRLRRMVQSLERLGIPGVLPVVADLATAGKVALRPGFAHVLVDAPCSGTGTLRRHPEIRWRLREADLAVLAMRQRRILETGASLLAPGGTLVYAVCSMEVEEGDAIVRGFLADRPEFLLEDPRPLLPPPARHLVTGDLVLRTSPADGLDGFFAVAMKRVR